MRAGRFGNRAESINRHRSLAPLAVEQIEARHDHDRRRPRMVQRLGTSPNTRKPSAVIQTISV